MSDKPIELDDRRGHSAQKDTEVGRLLQTVQADQAALRRRQEDLEHALAAAPAETWPDAAVKARYLIQLYAATHEAQDPRRKKLIAQVINDLDRLAETVTRG